MVAYNRTPDFYMKLLTSAGLDRGLNSWFQVLDCFTDPLGWKKKVLDNLKPHNSETSEIQQEQVTHAGFTVYRDVGNVDGLMSAIISSGGGLIGNQCKARFSVAIDLVSIMMRHLSLPSVASLINNLRCHDQISCVLLLIHSDVHNLRTSMALEYMSTMVAFIEPIAPLPRDSPELKSHPYNLAALEENLKRGRFRLRMKRRNGRVQEQIEEFMLEQADVKFSPITHGNLVLRGSSNIPQVQFNLQLTERERQDRAKVTLPFEHQGNGKEIHIYDGRKGSTEWKASPVSDSQEATRNSVIASSVTSKEGGRGEIHYVRDSDDEAPDSDEDPDDDLDI
ncbi:elongator complex protein 5 isoform X2 [Cryptomeria japonica]|nr:elongator complex protein 5 isoform X2 [Cryptomeria japonica]